MSETTTTNRKHELIWHEQTYSGPATVLRTFPSRDEALAFVASCPRLFAQTGYQLHPEGAPMS